MKEVTFVRAVFKVADNVPRVYLVRIINEKLN